MAQIRQIPHSAWVAPRSFQRCRLPTSDSLCGPSKCLTIFGYTSPPPPLFSPSLSVILAASVNMCTDLHIFYKPTQHKGKLTKTRQNIEEIFFINPPTASADLEIKLSIIFITCPQLWLGIESRWVREKKLLPK